MTTETAFELSAVCRETASTAATAPYSYSYVQFTYTCTVASGITSLGVTAIDGGVFQGIYTGYTPVTCDGTSRKMTYRGGSGIPGMSVAGTFCLVKANDTRVVTTNWQGTMANPPAVMPSYSVIQNKTGVAACG